MILMDGWEVFSEYCKKRGINQSGYHIRLLDKLDDAFKVDITPTSKNTTWVIYVPEADKIFKQGAK